LDRWENSEQGLAKRASFTYNAAIRWLETQ